MTRGKVILSLVVLALAGACGGEPPAKANAPPPAVATALPAELAASLPKSPNGLPLLLQQGGVLGPGIGLAFDASLDDPITRWAECLSRVRGCRATNAGAIAGCVDLVPVCATNAGGKGCCPASCVAAFKARVAAGSAEPLAVRESFLAGDCVDGFSSVRDAAIESEAGR